MPRYLVVANQTLGGDQLMNEIRQRISAGPASFYIVVPETPPVDVRAGLASDITLTEGYVPERRDIERREAAAEQRAQQTSQARLERLMRQIRAEGSEAQGETGHEDPLKAINTAMSRGEDFDEILISTLPTGVSRWLRMDLAHKVERKFKTPVTTVTAKPGS